MKKLDNKMKKIRNKMKYIIFKMLCLHETTLFCNQTKPTKGVQNIFIP